MRHLAGERSDTTRFDVIVLGEIMVELYCEQELTDGATLRLGFSGDALNAAAAAAAAGARTAILTAVGSDEVGDAIIRLVTELGVEPALIRRASRPNGAYLLHGDLTGHRQFSYWRAGSAASTLDEADITPHAAEPADAGAARCWPMSRRTAHCSPRPAPATRSHCSTRPNPTGPRPRHSRTARDPSR